MLDKLMTLVGGGFLFAVFCYIQYEIWRSLIGGGA